MHPAVWFNDEDKETDRMAAGRCRLSVTAVSLASATVRPGDAARVPELIKTKVGQKVLEPGLFKAIIGQA